MKDLGSFLQNEIKLEKENLSKTNKPVQIQGFDIKTEGPNVTLTKTFNNEQYDSAFLFNIEILIRIISIEFLSIYKDNS